MRQIVPGIWAIDGLKMGRSYLIADREGLTLIDSSSPDVAERIIAAIESIGRKPEELRTIVATHYHFDHTGNAGALRERTGAKIIAHADDKPYIEGEKPWGTERRENAWERLGERMLGHPHYTLPLDDVVREGDVIPAAGGLRVIHGPGHTPGEIALLAAEHRVLFAGDTFMNIVGLRLPAGGSTHDMAQAKQTIGRLAELDFDHALPGHGAPVLSRASEKLRMWAQKWVEPS
jgi:glyoxylase-like metal-dependent hydrolase (beta-lactamase superfamily II)